MLGIRWTATLLDVADTTHGLLVSLPQKWLIGGTFNVKENDYLLFM